MEQERVTPPEDWESMRALGHRMLGDMPDYLGTVRERPVWQLGENRARAQSPGGH